MQAHGTRLPRGDSSRRGPVVRYAAVLRGVGSQTKIIWVKGRAEKGGKLADRHEVGNKRAGEGAERAHHHLDTPAYKMGVCLSNGLGVWAHDPREGRGAQDGSHNAAAHPKGTLPLILEDTFASRDLGPECGHRRTRRRVPAHTKDKPAHDTQRLL